MSVYPEDMSVKCYHVHVYVYTLTHLIEVLFQTLYSIQTAMLGLFLCILPRRIMQHPNNTQGLGHL